MPELVRLSPLGVGKADAARRHPAPGFELRELWPVAATRIQTLRGDAVRLPFAAREMLPMESNRARGKDPCVLWRAPGDWLAYSLTLSATAVERVLGERLGGSGAVLTDVSCASGVLELRGERAVDVLLRDCTLDLEGGAIPPGACAQTALAQLSLLIHRPEPATSSGEDVWRLWVDRSAAHHLWDWLVDTAGGA